MEIDQSSPDAESFFDQAMDEVASIFEESVTIRRYSSSTAGDDAGGVADTPVYKDYVTTANIRNLEAKEIAFSNSTYALGDVQAEFRTQVFGPETYAGDGQAAGRLADQITWRGRKYKIVGHVFPVSSGSGYHWVAVLRQVG